MNNCIFCKIAAGEIPCNKVYEDELVLAYYDINPITPGHTLVIPKAHYENFLAAPDEVLKEVIVRVKQVAAILKEKHGFTDYNLQQNNGEKAGQTVMHLHFHLIPRY